MCGACARFFPKQRRRRDKFNELLHKGNVSFRRNRCNVDSGKASRCFRDCVQGSALIQKVQGQSKLAAEAAPKEDITFHMARANQAKGRAPLLCVISGAASKSQPADGMSIVSTTKSTVRIIQEDSLRPPMQSSARWHSPVVPGASHVDSTRLPPGVIVVEGRHSTAQGSTLSGPTLSQQSSQDGTFKWTASQTHYGVLRPVECQGVHIPTAITCEPQQLGQFCYFTQARNLFALCSR